MSTTRHNLIPEPLMSSESFRRDFRKMFALTEKQINTLAALAESKEGFEATERSLQEAAKALQLEYPRLAPLLAVVQFLYGHARAARIDESEAARQVCDFAEQLGIEDARAKAPAIARLFAKKEAYDRHVLVQSAKRAVVPTLLGVSIASDIRAVTDPTTDVILGYVPVTLVGLDLTSADRGVFDGRVWR